MTIKNVWFRLERVNCHLFFCFLIIIEYFVYIMKEEC